MKKLLQAKTFIIPCMRAGLCEYDEERVLVTNETLAAMAKTSYGIPLILPEHVEKEELEKNLEQYLAGRVADMHYDDKTDLWMAHCVADTQEAVDLFEKGWGVSTSYQVDEKAPGGTLNAVPYNSEIKRGTYLHLAIVEHPRYEMAKDPVFYNSLTQVEAPGTIENSEPKKGALIMKFWKTKKEEVKMNDASEMAVEVDGVEVPMNELVAAYKASKQASAEPPAKEEPKEEPKNEDAPPPAPAPEPKKEEGKPAEASAEPSEEEKLNAEVENLLASLEKDEEPKDNEDQEPKTEDEEPKEKETDEKKNARFNAMKAASQKSEVLDNGVAGFKTLHERAAEGRSRYGFKK